MTRTSLLSPDGLTIIKKITHRGSSYHLPPWIPENEFRDGLDSKDGDEALSSLIKCRLAGWSNEFDYGTKDRIDVPVFRLRFLVPYNSVRELVVNRFTPGVLRAPVFHEILHSFSTDGVTISFHAHEYQDFNEIQSFVLPKSFTDSNYPGSGEYNEESYDDLVADFEGAKKNALYWNGKYEEFTHNEEDYFFLLKVHED